MTETIDTKERDERLTTWLGLQIHSPSELNDELCTCGAQIMNEPCCGYNPDFTTANGIKLLTDKLVEKGRHVCCADHLA